MRPGLALWWCLGVVLALVVRLVWLATLGLPPNLDALGRRLFCSTEVWSEPAKLNQAGHSSGSEKAERLDDKDLWPVATRNVLYPATRGICSFLGWTHIPWFWVLAGLQTILQSLAVGGLAALAWQVFGSQLVNILLTLVLAFYPPWLVQLVSLNDLPVIVCIAGNWLALIVATSSTGGVIAPACVGLLAGGLVILRPGLGLAACIVTSWYLWQMRSVAHGWLASLVAALAFVNICGTWFLRHWLHTGEPLPLVREFWQFFADGIPQVPASDETRSGDGWQSLAQQVFDVWRRNPRWCLQYRLALWGDVLLGEPVYRLSWPKEIRTFDVVAPPALSAPVNGSSSLSALGPRLAAVSIEEIPAPEWVRPAFRLGLLPAVRLVMWGAFLFGWRWSFRLRLTDWPITATCASTLFAYGFGSYLALQWGVAVVEPLLLLYAVFALTVVIPGIWKLSAPSCSSPQKGAAATAVTRH